MSGRIACFEDLIPWQKARLLTKRLYHVTRQGPLSADRGLTSQMQRSAVSTMANIAEGYERDGLGEFQRYLVIAKASCGELKSHCYVALDAGYFGEATFSSLTEQVEEVPRLIRGLRTSVQKRQAQSTTRHAALGTRHSAH